MKYRNLFVLLITLLITGCGETYDSSIHNSKVGKVLNDKTLTKYMATNKYSDEYDLFVSKSDKKTQSEYADGKLYEYNVHIEVNSAFLTASRTTQFDYVDKIAQIFGENLAANESKYRGIYNSIIVSHGNYNDEGYMFMSMNVQGIRNLDYKTRDEFRLLYYDKDGKPVFD